MVRSRVSPRLVDDPRQRVNPHIGNHQNLRGQAVGIVDRLLQPCCMTDARTAPEKGLALQLKARLSGIGPMIWRRVLVPDTMSLHELHGVLQVAMGSNPPQQMRWSKSGAHLMLRTRFQSWYPGFFNAANSDQAMERTAA